MARWAAVTPILLLSSVVFAGAPAASSPSGPSSQALPDPMQPPAQIRPAKRARDRAPSWRLQSVLVSPGRRVAVINGRALAVGERIHGARLVAIHPGHVVLQQGSRRIVVRLAMPKVKKVDR